MSDAKRLIVVSNRLPIKATREKETLAYHRSAGGLATGLSSIEQYPNKVWVGWPGFQTDDSQLQDQVRRDLSEENLHPVFLSEWEFKSFYEGFSNKTIWPLFHYFTEYTSHDRNWWEAYIQVNQKFCRYVTELATPDDIIWVHDYQLLLLPSMLRAEMPQATIGFFLHIPFPSYDVFRMLPKKQEIIRGMMGADLVGFHTYEYMRNFLRSTERLLGLEHQLGRLSFDRRLVTVDSYPMGIDYEQYSQAAQKPAVQQKVSEIGRSFGKDTKVILSVDRLDYTKGIIQRLYAFETLLERHPELVGRVSIIILVVPSRAGVEEYQALKQELDTRVGFINGKYNTIDWTPVHYLYRSLPFEHLSALYVLSDIALVTPLRDGMNLVAKEFVAAKHLSQRGVLILSEMAGAAVELTEALIVNPKDTDEIAEAIYQALRMPEAEQERRLSTMQNHLRHHTVDAWASSFISDLENIRLRQQEENQKQLSEENVQAIIQRYEKSARRLLLLDYDGTLVDIENRPEMSNPPARLKELLGQLAADERNDVYILSGRDRQTLFQWFGGLAITLVAEHGAWCRAPQGDWKQMGPLSDEWKDDIRLVMERFVDRTPHSFIEEKEYALVWHYRLTDTWLGTLRAQELVHQLLYIAPRYNLQVLEGKKIVEIKNAGIDKGSAAGKILAEKDYQFVLAAGDDLTDEDMFKAVPGDSYSIKVGGGNTTAAQFTVNSPQDILLLLNRLVKDTETIG
jgi:trehalose 6-phosphate synthase/phosphatase